MLIFIGKNEVFGFPQPQSLMFNGFKIPKNGFNQLKLYQQTYKILVILSSF